MKQHYNDDSLSNDVLASLSVYKSLVLSILLFVSCTNKGLGALSSSLPDNFTSTTEAITLIRDCKASNRHDFVGNGVTSLDSLNASISTAPTLITFSFAAEMSIPINTTNSINTATDTKSSLIRNLNQMILETAAEAVLSCKTTSVLSSEAQDSVVTISLETTAVSELSSISPTYVPSSVRLNAYYIINDTLSVSLSNKAVEDWVVYNALMGIKLSMVDDLYLSSTSLNARDGFIQNVHYLHPDPSILRSSYANSISKSIHVILFVTLMLSLFIVLFILFALLKRRDKIFQWKGGVAPVIIIPKYKLSSTRQETHPSDGVML
jgi:hypothetical protein